MTYLGDIGGLLDIVLIGVSALNGAVLSAYLRIGITQILFTHELPKVKDPSDIKKFKKDLKKKQPIKLSFNEKLSAIVPLLSCLIETKGKRKIK